MCLAVPGKIVKITGDVAIVDYSVEQREAKILDEEFLVGDFVVVQGGFVVMKIPEEEALRSLEMYVQSLDGE